MQGDNEYEMNNYWSPENIGYLKETICHSRAVIKLFHNFKIKVHNGDDYLGKYEPLIKKYEDKVPSKHLGSYKKQLIIHGNKNAELDGLWNTVEEYHHVFNLSDKHDNQIQFTEVEETKYVTLSVHKNSISINNGNCYELPFPLITAEILEATAESKEDTLVLFLIHGILLIRFTKSSTDTTDNFLPLVVDSIQSEVFEEELSSIYFNSNKNLMIISQLSKSLYFYKIKYDINGIPHTCFCNTMANSFKSFESFGSCMLTVSNSEDAFIDIRLQNDILFIVSISNFENPIIHENIMTNDFPLPEKIVHLTNINAVLILELDGTHESKIVCIDAKYRTPILKTIKTFWSQIYPYPVMDFTTIDSNNGKKSIETPSKELWAITGTGITHSITVFRFGIFSKKKDSYKLCHIPEKLYSFESNNTTYVWASSINNSILLQKDDNTRKLKPVNHMIIDEKFISHEWFDKETLCLISNHTIYFFNIKNLNFVFFLTLPQKCYLAHSFGNLFAVVYEEKKLALFRLNKDRSCTSIPVHGLSTNYSISLVNFYNSQNGLMLHVGYFNNMLSIFEENDNCNVFKLNNNIDISEALTNNHLENSNFSFIPHQIHHFDDFNFILTSKNGEYTLMKMSPLKYRSGIYGWNYTKLGDSGSIDIIYHPNSNRLFLLSKTLWELKVNISSYPERIKFKGSVSGFISACAPLPGTNMDILVSNNLELNIYELFNNFSVDVLRNKLDYPCVSMMYFQSLDIFILVSRDYMNAPSTPKLLYVEACHNKTLKTKSDINNIFDIGYYPTCLCEWKLETNSGCYYNLIVGTTKLPNGKLLFLGLKRNGNQIETSLVSSTIEDGGVTHIVYENKYNLLIYSCGKNLCYRTYSSRRSKFSRKEVIINADDFITRFNYKVIESQIYFVLFTEFFGKTEVTAKLLVNSIDDITRIHFDDEDQFDDENAYYEEVHYDECDKRGSDDNFVRIVVEDLKMSDDTYCYDALFSGNDVSTENNAIEKKLTIYQKIMNFPMTECISSFEAGYGSRISFVESFSPWLNIEDRQKALYKHFLIVTPSCQIDILKFIYIGCYDKKCISPGKYDDNDCDEYDDSGNYLFTQQFRNYSKSYTLPFCMLDETKKKKIVSSKILKDTFQENDLIEHSVGFTSPKCDFFINNIRL
ncbi:hypothetical protein C6P40_003294 [Pichia californica]|uniref:Cleavage/polyadenylation specificity factor A subunit N-terminal domain-containing protein n=1 Tax=Pichia californica TaxID=460514 RepID=A0A9P6WIS5_9ASCO|nr:hypothetical protein C6P40_003294 [[Candida] californica]